MTLTEELKDKARNIGFTLAGVTTAEPPPHFPAFLNWLEMGRNGSMDYLRDPRRADPHLLMEKCKSILVLGARYYASIPERPESTSTGRVAAYAKVEDYHPILSKKMRILGDFIEREIGHLTPFRMYTDTGPLLERDLAQKAGLGWIGKNTCLINPEAGSFFFLSEILMEIELIPDAPFTADRCGTCQRCIDACPTGCMLPDRTIDASRCISYLTIENKGGIPNDLRSKMGNWIFGCDICQEVCPWNARAKPIDTCLFHSLPGILASDLDKEVSLSPQEFNRKFKSSSILRARRGGYLRNVSVALGNQKNPSSIPALEQATLETDVRIKTHAQWALDQIRNQ
jgi:epoxyqueuosine reductase